MKEKDIKEGMRFYNPVMDMELRVMCICEGYVMARRKRCIPFCNTVKNFVKFVKNLQVL